MQVVRHGGKAYVRVSVHQYRLLDVDKLYLPTCSCSDPYLLWFSIVVSLCLLRRITPAA